jgi:hypothetical protein
MRKNENALKEFDEQICQMPKDRLKTTISQRYIYYFNKIDQKIEK